MTLTPFTIEQFGALNLVADPFEIGAAGATDLLNVDFDRLGRLRTRDGYASFAAATGFGGPAAINNVIPSAVGTGRLYVTYWDTTGTQYCFQGFDSSGTSVALRSMVASATATTPSYASLGTSVTAYTYFTIWDASVNYTCQRITAGGISNGTGKPAFVAVSPVSNRLVEANFDLAASSPSGANGSRSTVFWSDAGDPQTFGANNFVTLRPNDGEEITGVVTWRNATFIAKQSSLFIFEGEGIDSTGQPIFQNRRVDLPAPVWRSTGLNRSPMVACGEFGVALSTANGIYLSTGDTPRLITGKVQELFGTASNFSSLQFDGNPPILAWANGRLLATYKLATGGATRTLVWDPRTDDWTIWSNLGTTGVFATWAPGAYTTTPATADFQERLLFPITSTVYYTDPDVTTDNGTAISWSTTSGKYLVADSGRVAVVPETSLDGYGTVTLSLLSDLYAAQSASVTLGTNPTVSEGWPTPVDQEGRWLQFTLSGTGQALVSRMQHQVSFVKSAGIR